MINNTRGPQHLPMQYASQLLKEGQRLMDTMQAVDQSNVDKNQAPGQVQLDTPTPYGINHLAGVFSGDRYEGTLETNSDPRGLGLDRKYEFRSSEGKTIITQQLPSYGEVRYDRYVIDTGHVDTSTVEHVWQHTHSA